MKQYIRLLQEVDESKQNIRWINPLYKGTKRVIVLDESKPTQ